MTAVPIRLPIREAAKPTLAWFAEVIRAEREALQNFEQQPPAAIEDVVTVLLTQKDPIACIGVGKSGLVAAKVAATFSSLGTPAFFLNAAEAAHGDLGAVRERSAVVLFSNSGSTEEILRIVPILKARSCPLIGIVGNVNSPIGRAVELLLPAPVGREADHLGMAPTASTTLQMAIGDALAVAVSRTKGFTRTDFLRHHPAGLLGRQMIPIRTLMKCGSDLPTVLPSSSVAEVLAVMFGSRLGAACVVDHEQLLLGLIVDGDIRRHFLRRGDVYATTACSLMRCDPHVIGVDATVGDALLILRSADRSLLVLPVVDDTRRLCGVLLPQEVLNG